MRGRPEGAVVFLEGGLVFEDGRNGVLVVLGELDAGIPAMDDGAHALKRLHNALLLS